MQAQTVVRCRNTGRFKNIFCPWRIWNECHCFSCGRKHKQSNRYTGYHPDIIEKQIDAVFEDIEVDAVKIGMLSTEASMKTVAKKLEQYKPKNVVIDPVMYAKNGCPLMNPSSIDTLIKEVLPYADVLTPNIPEAEKYQILG